MVITPMAVMAIPKMMLITASMDSVCPILEKCELCFQNSYK